MQKFSSTLWSTGTGIWLALKRGYILY
jgi:hypothetical protein